MLRTGLLAVALALCGGAAVADALRLGVPTAIEASGLGAALASGIEADTGVTVELVVAETGPTLALVEDGAVDAILSFAPEASETALEAGFALDARAVLASDLVFVGPERDVAKLRQFYDVNSALRAIGDVRAPFISRGDGTDAHLQELSLWRSTEIVVDDAWDWYVEGRGGVADMLSRAERLNGYALLERAEWLANGQEGALVLLFDRDPSLAVEYVFLTLEDGPEARAVGDWLTSAAGRAAIEGHRLGDQVVFRPAGGDGE